MMSAIAIAKQELEAAKAAEYKAMIEWYNVSNEKTYLHPLEEAEGNTKANSFTWKEFKAAQAAHTKAVKAKEKAQKHYETLMFQVLGHRI